MAEINKTEPNEFEKANVNPFNSPTPGEGLTQSPEQKFPWEQPSKHTEVKPVMEEIFLQVTEKILINYLLLFSSSLLDD